LIWTMILRYQLTTKDDGSANKDLLDWVNSVIEGHGKVHNFTKDWQDGTALSYLVGALLPGSIKKEHITTDKMKNIKNAMTIARDKMHVPEIVDPEDMADHPDSLSNMTYISYFREFEKAKKAREIYEQTVVAIECIAQGPGLLPGVGIGVITGFNIEARNGDGKRVPQGGAVFGVKITGPNADVVPKITDGGDGSYIVEYTATEGGNHFIQVTHNGTQIKGSPFQVPVTKAVDKPKAKTVPAPHWYYEDTHYEGLLKQVSRWVEYDENTSNEIEKAFKSNPYGESTVFNGQSTVDFQKMLEKSQVKKGTKRRIMRGVWFFQDDDGTWAPYEPYTAQLLENEFQTGHFQKVNVSDKPPRWVISFADGTYKQFRQTKGGNPNGREVLRGYKGQVTEISTT